jgi:HlyD family secretion protein
VAKRNYKRWALIGVFTSAAGITIFGLGFRTADLPATFTSGDARIDIATNRPGRLARVLVVEGDLVEPGQVLAQMDTAELEADLRQAEAELRQALEDKNQAVAAVSQRESDLKQTRASINQRESEIKQARATVSQRESELALAIKEFERAQALVARDLIAREQVEQAYSRKQTAEAALNQEQARKLAAEATLALEQARQHSAEAALRNAQVEVAQRDLAIDAGKASMQKIRTAIDDSALKSPIRGRVLDPLAKPGETLAAGDKVLTVLELSGSESGREPVQGSSPLTVSRVRAIWEALWKLRSSRSA